MIGEETESFYIPYEQRWRGEGVWPCSLEVVCRIVDGAYFRPWLGGVCLTWRVFDLGMGVYSTLAGGVYVRPWLEESQVGCWLLWASKWRIRLCMCC